MDKKRRRVEMEKTEEMKETGEVVVEKVPWVPPPPLKIKKIDIGIELISYISTQNGKYVLLLPTTIYQQVVVWKQLSPNVTTKLMGESIISNQ